MSRRKEFPFAALSNPVRTDILSLLAGGVELSVTQISEAVPAVGRTAISTHLGLLLDAGLVKVRRVGRHSFYSLDTSLVELAVEFLQALYGEALAPTDRGDRAKAAAPTSAKPSRRVAS